MLVPLIVFTRCGIGQADNTSTPGATTSTAPVRSTVPLEKSATASSASIAPTAMIDEQFAGWLTGAINPLVRLMSLPAAATISATLSHARRADPYNLTESR